MPTLYLVRHGRAAAGFDEDLDPGLDEMGRSQAFVVVDALKKEAAMPIITSPLMRCQETAKPLANRWNVQPKVVDEVREIPSPTEDPLERGKWLFPFMEGDWSAGDDTVLAWRQGVIDALAAIEEDTVIFSHFIAINAALGHAQGSDKVVVARIDNGSITKIKTDGDSFEVLEIGKEAKTRVR